MEEITWRVAENKAKNNRKNLGLFGKDRISGNLVVSPASLLKKRTDEFYSGRETNKNRVL